MSESSSDTESSCGWTLISNEGSDIETLGPENGAERGPDPADGPPVLEEEEEAAKQNDPTAARADGNEERSESCLDTTMKEETVEEMLPVSEVGGEDVTEESLPVCSSSDHSDIVTLDPSKVAELGPWEEQVVPEGDSLGNEELYLGTSSSSQYTFSTPEKTLFPVEPPGGGSSSSSSDDETEEQPSQTVRRRRVRRSTNSAPEAEEARFLGQEGEEEEQAEHQQQQERGRGAPAPGHVNGTLNKCILLALVVAISMGFGHFYGTVQIKERHKMAEKICLSEPSGPKGGIPQCQTEQDLITKSKDLAQRLSEDLEEKRGMVRSLTGIVDKITKENKQLKFKLAELQAQKDDLTLRLKESVERNAEAESQQKRLASENRQLKSSLEREEASLSTLQEELRKLRGQIRSLEDLGSGVPGAADSILSENRRLKDHLEEEKQRIRSFLRQKEALMAEAQMLRRELDRERKVTDRLKEELEQLSVRSAGTVGEADPETQELRARLTELERKLNFEQQRSDLWERLYVETKEERLKGDQQARDGGPRESVIGKVAETFDAVKNSTKEFVHHHKEQIKKAKEAVKENLRKFSDSVKSTFRHFKDSATRTLDKVHHPGDRKVQERKETKAEAPQQRHQTEEQEPREKDSDGPAWQQQKPLHQRAHWSKTESFPTDRNTRKQGAKVQEEPQLGNHRGTPKGCSSVFDCAYQESMSLFNKALDPIRMDEFNQLIHSYLQQEVNQFHHWRELESFIKNFFHNGVFIHDQMLFTDFVSGVEDYLEDMDEYQSHENDDVFEDLDEYVYRHFFGDTYAKRYGPRPLQGPTSKSKEDSQLGLQRKQQAHSRPNRERKWSRPAHASRRHIANVKIELGPLPFDPKY